MKNDFLGAAIPPVTEFNEWIRIRNIIRNYRTVLNVIGWEASGTSQTVNEFSYKHINDAGNNWILTLCSFFIVPTGQVVNSLYRPFIGSIVDNNNASVSYVSSATHSQTRFSVNFRGGKKDVVVIQQPYQITTAGSQDIFVSFHPIYDGSGLIDPHSTEYYGTIGFNHRKTQSIAYGEATEISAINVNSINSLVFADQFYSTAVNISSSLIADNRFSTRVEKGIAAGKLLIHSGAEIATRSSPSNNVYLGARRVTGPGVWTAEKSGSLFFLSTNNYSKAKYFTLAGNITDSLSSPYLIEYFTTNSDPDSKVTDILHYTLDFKTVPIIIRGNDYKWVTTGDPLNPQQFADFRRVFSYFSSIIMPRVLKNRPYGVLEMVKNDNHDQSIYINPYKDFDSQRFVMNLFGGISYDGALVNFDFYNWFAESSNYSD